jgi:putative membrane protein
MTQQQLTLISTSCIVLSGLSLLWGWITIRRQQVRSHKIAMLAATAFAGLFLIAYVSRWSLYGSKPFGGEGAWRTFYLVNLIPHILFAMVVGPLAIRQIYLALGKRDFPRHRRLGRILVPIWLYVAASGWLIYFLLYHF